MESTISPITAALVNAGAGTLGGIASFSLFYPLENFRTRLQAREKPETHDLTDVLETLKIKDKPLTLYDRLISRLKKLWADILETLQFGYDVYQKQGISAFYQGLGSGVFGIGVSNAVYMYWYQLLKDLMHQFRSTLRALAGRSRRHVALTPMDNIIVASLAGVVNITITNPIWVINLRQTLRNNVKDESDNNSNIKEAVAEKTPKTPILQLFKSCDFKALWQRFLLWFRSTELGQLLAEDGLMGLYKGYAASLVLVLNPTIQFVVYDQLVAYFQGKNSNTPQQTQSLSGVQVFLISALAKALSTVTTFPYLVVKTRMQQNNKTVVQKAKEEISKLVKETVGIDINPSPQAQDELPPEQQVDQTDLTAELNKIKDHKEVLGLYDTMVDMYAKEGPGVFFRGLGPKLVQTVLNAALTSVLHERIKDYMMDMLEGDH